MYPDLMVVGYVNTTADVKAECDACCTSSNAVRVVEALPSRHILFVPDQNLAAYVQTQTTKDDHRLGRQLLRPPPDHAGADPARCARRCRG